MRQAILIILAMIAAMILAEPIADRMAQDVERWNVLKYISARLSGRPGQQTGDLPMRGCGNCLYERGINRKRCWAFMRHRQLICGRI